MIKKILILAKSSKRRHDGAFGSCVAGIDNKGNFIRLVADRFGDSLTDKEAQFEPLDIIECEVSEPYPIGNQTENCIIDSATINFISKQDILFIKKLYEEDRFPRKSFFGSMQNRIDNDQYLGHSLSVICVKDLLIYRDENYKYKADFSIGKNRAIRISMTDPDYYKQAKNAAIDSPIVVDNAILFVSLPGTPIYHKFIAKIFEI